MEDELNNRDKLSSTFPVLDANEQAVNSILAKTPTLNDPIDLSYDEANTNRAQINSNTISFADSTAMWEVPSNFFLGKSPIDTETGFATADMDWVRNIFILRLKKV